MTDRPRAWTPPKSSALKRLLTPGQSDAERAFPALRRARGSGGMSKGGESFAALDAPEGDWSMDILARHADARRAIDVVLADAMDPLDGLTILEPFVAARMANRIDCLDEKSGAIFGCDVEGEHDYRVRYCSVDWPDGSSADDKAFAAFFAAWRQAAMTRLSAGPVPNEDLTPNVVNPRAFAWCLGPRDRMQVTLEKTNKGQTLSATRAWAERREVCT